MKAFTATSTRPATSDQAIDLCEIDDDLVLIGRPTRKDKAVASIYCVIFFFIFDDCIVVPQSSPVLSR